MMMMNSNESKQVLRMEATAFHTHIYTSAYIYITYRLSVRSKENET